MIHRVNGFTLTETMVILAISAVVVAFAAPSFYTTLQNNRLTTNTNDFITALNLARSEAIKRGKRVTVCKSKTGKKCTTSGSWEQGWIIFVDTNNSAQISTGSKSTEILRVHGPLENGGILKGNTNVEDYVSYVPSGYTEMITGTIQMGTLIMCDDRMDTVKAKAITINRTGRLNVGPGNESTMTCES
jgi:type IV fimbrial biogenesis protein FimT